MNDLRWKLAVLIFLSIPVCGGWYLIKHYRIMSNEVALDLSALPTHIDDELKLVRLSGFSGEDVFVRRNNGAEFAVVNSPKFAGDAQVVVVLKRRRTDEPVLANDIADGVVTGLVSAGEDISREDATKLGLELPDTTAQGFFFVVEVDREYITPTCAVTLAFLLLGSILLSVVHFKLQDSQFENDMWQVKATSQAALQVKIAEHIGYRKTL